MRFSFLFSIAVLFLPFNGLGQSSSFSLGEPENACVRAKVQSQKVAFDPSISRQTDLYDLGYLRARWTMIPGTATILGDVTHYFKALKNIDTLVFDFIPNFTISNIRFRNSTLNSFYLDKQLFIPLPQACVAGANDSIQIQYSGVPGNSGFGSFYNSASSLHTLSQPYGVRDWWPGKITLNDKIDSADIIVSTQPNFTAVSNGILWDTLQAAGLTQYHWKHRYPIEPYLLAVAVSAYTHHDTSVNVLGKPLRIEHFVYTNPSQWISKINDLRGMLEVFTQYFGEYPFIKEKYGHTEFAWGGGMEHQTNSFMGGNDFELVAHELAHQWFGDAVTCRTWQDIWLNESFATWLSGLAMEKLIDPYWFQRWKWLQKNNAISPTLNGTIFVSDTSDFQRIFNYNLTYSKGAAVLNQLRYQLGDDVIFPALKGYLQDSRLRYSYAGSKDLQTHLESACQCSLQAYFNQWIYGQGFPNFAISFAQYGDVLKVYTSQIPLKGAKGLFGLKVPIRFYNASRTDSMSFFYSHTVNGQLNFFQVPFKVDSAAFDPDFVLLANGNFTRLPANDPGVLVIMQEDGRNLWVQLNQPLGGITKMELFDSQGRLVRTIDTSASLNLIKLGMDGLSSGIYNLRVQVDDETIVTRKVFCF